MNEMSLSELSAVELREIDGGAYGREVVDPKAGQVVIISDPGIHPPYSNSTLTEI